MKIEFTASRYNSSQEVQESWYASCDASFYGISDQQQGVNYSAAGLAALVVGAVAYATRKRRMVLLRTSDEEEEHAHDREYVEAGRSFDWTPEIGNRA
jgi:hypothetical protein